MQVPSAGFDTPGTRCSNGAQSTNRSAPLGLRSPAEYVASLRDGRAVYFKGERVEDVTRHPTIGIAVEHACIDYSMAEDDRYRDLATVAYENGPDRYSRYYRLPSSTEDLLLRSRLIE